MTCCVNDAVIAILRPPAKLCQRVAECGRRSGDRATAGHRIGSESALHYDVLRRMAKLIGQRSSSTPAFQAHNLPSMPFTPLHYGYKNTARLCTSAVSRLHEAALLPLPYIIGVLLQRLFSYCLSWPSDNGCRAIPTSFSATFIPSFDPCQASRRNPPLPCQPASA